MRNLAAPALSLMILAACGGAEKPATSAADTSSLEPKGSAADTPAPAATSDEPAPKASAAPQAAPAPASASSAAAPAASPAAAIHPTPAAAGSIDGKPFSPKIARSTAAMQKDGRLLLTITEGMECGSKPGEAALSLLVEWKDGYKTDVGSLKRATRPGGGEVGFSRGPALSKTFKPTGRVTVVSAPTDANATGKLKVDVQSGDFMLAGDLDVLLCVAAK